MKYDLGLLFCAALTVVLSNSADAAGVYPRSDFDGIAPLHYATINAGAEHLPLYDLNPASCASLPSCKVAGYAATGDVVAIDATHDSWSHVQYIGKTQVVEGWVESARLWPLAAQLPFDDGTPGRRDRRWYPQKWQIHVALLKGKGVPVCEAYLQRLNQTYFYEPPYCGRPENDQVPGFTRLHAVALSPTEVNRLTVTEANLVAPVNRNFVESPGAVELAASSTSAPVYLDTQGLLAAVRTGENISVWRYEPPVDIDNDGTPDNLILWRSGGRPVWDQCGQLLSNGRVNLEGPTAFILTKDNSGIDATRTLMDFEDLASERYHRLKYSIGVFQYRGEYYFDAFVDGEMRDSPASLSEPREDYRKYLHVFHRKDSRVEHACQLVNSDLDDWRAE